MFYGVTTSGLSKPLVPQLQLIDLISYSTNRLFLNEEFLRQKYIIEELSSTQIAKEVGSSKSAVLKYLKKFNIPVRPPSKSINGKCRGYGLPYGKRIVKNKMVSHKKEQSNIQKMCELREKGYSYWKIAEVFNFMRVPTQTRKGKWYAKTIQQILIRVKKV